MIQINASQADVELAIEYMEVIEGRDFYASQPKFHLRIKMIKGEEEKVWELKGSFLSDNKVDLLGKTTALELMDIVNFLQRSKQ